MVQSDTSGPILDVVCRCSIKPDRLSQWPKAALERGVLKLKYKGTLEETRRLKMRAAAEIWIIKTGDRAEDSHC